MMRGAGHARKGAYEASNVQSSFDKVWQNSVSNRPLIDHLSDSILSFSCSFIIVISLANAPHLASATRYIESDETDYEDDALRKLVTSSQDNILAASQARKVKKKIERDEDSFASLANRTAKLMEEEELGVGDFHEIEAAMNDSSRRDNSDKLLRFGSKIGGVLKSEDGVKDGSAGEFESSEAMTRPGAMVRLCGLKRFKRLNGMFGKVLGVLSDGRIRVHVNGRGSSGRTGDRRLEVISLKPEKLELIEGAVLASNGAIAGAAVGGKDVAGGSARDEINRILTIDDGRLTPYEISRQQTASTPQQFTRLISSISRQGRMEAAIHVLSRMMERSIRANSFTYNALLAGCERKGEWLRALELVDEMRAKRIAVTDYSFNILMKTASRAGEWEMAYRFFNYDMPREGGLRQTQVTYSTMMNTLSNSHQWKRAFALFEGMEKKLIRHDSISFTDGIRALSYAPLPTTHKKATSTRERGQHAWMRAQALFESMMQKQLKPTVYTFRALMEALEAGHAWNAMMGLVRRMDSRAVLPDTRIYASITKALVNLHRWAAAVKLLDDMEAKHIPLAPGALAYAIKAHSHTGNWEAALMLFDKVQQQQRNGRGPSATEALLKSSSSSSSAHLLGVMVQMRERNHEWREALSLYRELSRNDHHREHRRHYGGRESSNQALFVDEMTLAAAARSCVPLGLLEEWRAISTKQAEAFLSRLCRLRKRGGGRRKKEGIVGQECDSDDDDDDRGNDDDSTQSNAIRQVLNSLPRSLLEWLQNQVEESTKVSAIDMVQISRQQQEEAITSSNESVVMIKGKAAYFRRMLEAADSLPFVETRKERPLTATDDAGDGDGHRKRMMMVMRDKLLVRTRVGVRAVNNLIGAMVKTGKHYSGRNMSQSQIRHLTLIRGALMRRGHFLMMSRQDEEMRTTLSPISSHNGWNARVDTQRGHSPHPKTKPPGSSPIADKLGQLESFLFGKMSSMTFATTKASSKMVPLSASVSKVIEALRSLLTSILIPWQDRCMYWPAIPEAILAVNRQLNQTTLPYSSPHLAPPKKQKRLSLHGIDVNAWNGDAKDTKKPGAKVGRKKNDHSYVRNDEHENEQNDRISGRSLRLRRLIEGQSLLGV